MRRWQASMQLQLLLTRQSPQQCFTTALHCMVHLVPVITACSSSQLLLQVC